MVPIVTRDNSVALESNITFSLSIANVTPELVIGGPTSTGMFHGRINITIEDNDSKFFGGKLKLKLE